MIQLGGGSRPRRTLPSATMNIGHGYFEYFGEQAGSKQHGFYSFDAGGWHFIALNSNCNRVGGCGQCSPQMQWLRQDLEAHKGQCTIAYWHHPRFSSWKFI